MDLKCASFFAGVGGIDKGFENAGFKTIYANEIDENAAKTFKANFPNVQLDISDIRQLDENKDIPNFDVMLAGFPCQAFSIAGYQQGFHDEKGRGNLFFEIMRIVKAKKPKIIFLENVKNLVSHDNGNTFQVISESLEKEGYHVKSMVLNSSNYGNVPQSRERIYIVCFKDYEQYRNFEFPKPIKLTTKLHDVIDFENDVDKKYYYTTLCSFYKELKNNMTKSDTCYQWRRVYVRENKSNLCPTLTANMGTGGHNVPLIRTFNGKFRKLTPRECFNLQGFSKDFILPNSLSASSLYKQAGNSVVVSVIERLAEQIKIAVSKK
ncbi:DNA cytosine methyltransferase [Mycoplasmopsis iners]|uniref:DNA cytosine methyltransferase n=1 Tax=Mycoplasmopsis iners TaxID=76630 RepID=UPI0004978FD9|nr:DNA cytosine methyltransferase [Mycoplasmopsis iners]